MYVDLDGTLVHTDMSAETLIAAVLHSPALLLALPRWWLHGRALVKARLVEAYRLDAASLPYNEPLLALLRARKRQHRLVLASGAHADVVDSIAAYCGFDDTISSNEEINRVGRAKLQAIELAQGGAPFGYAGNANVDQVLFAAAEHCLVVNPSSGLVDKVKSEGHSFELVDDRRVAVQRWFACLAAPEAVGNLLVLLPAVLMGDMTFVQWLVTFVGLSALTSGARLWRAMADLQADRHHPRRRLRGLANGEIHPGLALGLGILLPLAGVIMLVGSSLLSTAAGLLLAYGICVTGPRRRTPWWLTVATSVGGRLLVLATLIG